MKDEWDLNDFVNYCKMHPEERFWQALRNWADVNFVLISDVDDVSKLDQSKVKDTFYW